MVNLILVGLALYICVHHALVAHRKAKIRNKVEAILQYSPGLIQDTLATRSDLEYILKEVEKL